jgi:septin family protein
LREGAFSRFNASALIPLSSFQEIVNYLERQYDDILAEQSRIKRNPRFRDNRVHALLYFISPTGHQYVLIAHMNSASAHIGFAA